MYSFKKYKHLIDTMNNPLVSRKLFPPVFFFTMRSLSAPPTHKSSCPHGPAIFPYNFLISVVGASPHPKSILVKVEPHPHAKFKFSVDKEYVDVCSKSMMRDCQTTITCL